MKITDFFSLLGGLALFLYGMQMMSIIPLRYADDEQWSGGCCREQNETDSGKAHC